MTLDQAADQAVKKQVAEIKGLSAPAAAKYKLLENLYFRVTEHHPDGIAAKVLADVSKAQTEIMYPNGKEVMQR